MMQDESMEVRFTITEEEYVNANKLFTELSKRTLFIYGISCAALAAIAFIAESPVLKIAAISGIVGGVIGDLCVRRVYAPIQTKKQYREYKATQEPISMSKQDGGLVFESAVGNANIEWYRIVKWRENKELILIYQARQIYHIVPKRIGKLANEISKELNENNGTSS